MPAWFGLLRGLTTGAGFWRRDAGALQRRSLCWTSGEPTSGACRPGLRRDRCTGTPGAELTFDIASQHVADRHEPARMVPQSCAGDDLDQAFATSIPSAHLEAAPACLGTGEAFSQVGLPFSDNTWPPDGAGAVPGRRIEQARMQTQASDHAHAPAHRIQQVDGGVAPVGHRNDLPARQPSRRLQQTLSAPVGQLLVPPLAFAGIAF